MAVPGEGIAALDDLLDGSRPLAADVLIHTAWSCVPATAEMHPQRMAEVDLPWLARLLDRLRLDPHPPLIVFLSTGAVYGPAPGRPSRENDVPAPIGAYARGKLAAEELLRASGLPACILRIGNLYGLPSSPQDRQGVIARLIRCALASLPFERWGDDPVKDYLHSDDFFTALQLVTDLRLTGTWNVGSGTATPLSHIIRLVEDATGQSIAVIPRPGPAWDVADNRLDSTPFQKKTAWHPRVKLHEGVAREVATLRPE